MKSWTTWFTADLHFGHKNIIDFCNRPFHDEFYMNEEIIENFNKLIKPNDRLIIIGDGFFNLSTQEMTEILNRLNGHKILIRGNHDQKPHKMMDMGFDICVEEAVMIIHNERIQLSHYPFAMPEWKYKYRKYANKIKRKLGVKYFTWAEKYHERRPKNKGQFLLHGHTHSQYRCIGRQIHVGVDAWNYKPVNIQEIANLISKIKEAEKKGQKLILKG